MEILFVYMEERRLMRNSTFHFDIDQSSRCNRELCINDYPTAQSAHRPSFHHSLNKTRRRRATHPEEGHGGSALEGAVVDLVLFGQILGRLDGRRHTLDGEEGGQVGRVRRDDDQREEPPDGADDARRRRLGVEVGALLHQRPHREPETVAQRELVLHQRRVGRARVRVAPLERTEMAVVVL